MQWIAAVLDSQVALDTVIADWITSYEKSAEDALLNLANFLIRSCGCTQFVSADEFSDEDNLLETLQDILLRYKEVIYMLLCHFGLATVAMDMHYSAFDNISIPSYFLLEYVKL
jgi:hypothetical protein